MSAHYMVDLETLSLRPNATILSIGLVNILRPETSLYLKLNTKLQPLESFHRDSETLLWWQGQDAQVREDTFGGTLPPVEVCDALYPYLKLCDSIWANGADFDLPILANLFRFAGIETPWKYSATRCYRTVKSLFPEVTIPKLQASEAHNALKDAEWQAAHLRAILGAHAIAIR